MKKTSIAIALLIQLIFSSITLATEWTVDLNGGGDYLDIQSALDAAAEGDTIIVEQGFYRGAKNTNLNFQGKAITLKSYSGSSKTIIDCANYSNIQTQNTRVFNFISGEEADSVVDGFTIRNGNISNGEGGGIYCKNSSPTFLNCSIDSCTSRKGGGFYGYNSKSIFKNCEFRNNYAQDRGGALFVDIFNSNIVLERCVIKNNQAGMEGGGVGIGQGNLNFYNCILSGNISNNGAAISGNSFKAFNCTFVKNKAMYNSIFTNSNYSTLTNCIVWGNQPLGTKIYSISCSYSIIQGGAIGTGVWDIDPLLTSDGHLQKNSPCIDAGEPYWLLNVADFDGDYPYFDFRTDIGCDQYVDLDQDGLPNWWELKYYGDIIVADPLSDSDNDANIALEEYKNSTNPFGAYYVDSNGNDDWDGLASEWDGLHGPKATIQDAVDSADTGSEIIVNDGIYTGTGNRDIYIVLEKELYIHSAGGPKNCIIDCNGTEEQPHFAFAISSRSSLSKMVLEGFKITNAHDSSSEEMSAIGAINISGRGNAVIKKCDISGNHATGIFTNTTEGNIIDCQINNNIGGALQVTPLSGYSPDPRNPKLLKITNCKMYGNFSHNYGSAVNIQRANSGGFPVFTNCVIAGNYSATDEGAVYQEGPAFFMNCTVTENKGGAFYNRYRNPSIMGLVNTIISQNSPYDFNVNYFRPGRESCFIGSSPDPLFRAKGIWSANIDPNLIMEPNQLQTLWEPGNYRLQPNSPCVDAGVNRYAQDYYDIDGDGLREEYLAFDMDWRVRIADGDGNDSNIIDIGAYELSNEAPVAEAGPNQICYAWIDNIADVVLDGSDSNDPDGDSLIYNWSWTIDTIVFDANGISPTIELPIGTHTIQLVVNDGLVDSEPDDVNITVIAPIVGKLSIIPITINRRSNQQHIIAMMDLPESVAKNDIDFNESLSLYPGDITASKKWVLPYSYKGRKYVKILAFFDKNTLMDAVPQNGQTELDVVGKLKSGQYFYGSDTVRIISLKLKLPW
jgi:hypothetical protein